MIVTEQNASDVVCPHVLVIGERTHPYQLPKCDRFPIIRTTAKKLWCETPDGEKLFDQAKVYCIAGDSEWNQFEEHYHNFQGALDELAHALQQLGSYKSQLEAQGGMKKAPNPLSPTVIAIDDPDYEQSMTLYETWGIPEIKRRRVNRHTPQMLKTAPPDEHPEWGEHCQAQHNNFVCPSDEDWERISQLHAAALQDSQKLIRHLESLGIYAETATRADLAQNVTPQIEEHSSEQNDASEERRWWVGDLLIGANQTGTVTEAIDKEVQVQWVNSKGGICNELYPRRQLKYLSEFEYREQFSVGDRAEALVPIPFGAIPTFTERLKTEIGELGTIIKVMDTGLCVTWDVGETVYSIDPTQVKRLEPIAWKESDRIWHGTPDNQGEVLEDLGEGVYKIKLDGKPEPFLVDRETIHPIYSQAVVPSSIDRYLERNSEPVLDSYPKEEWLNPGLIVLDCGTQSRPFEFDQERLDDYAEAMKTGDWEMERHPLPEVCLAEDGLYYAVDCHHRAQAGAIALPPGQQMLFLVRKGTLAQARIWSAAANTMHGLAADNSPKGVRKRVEMFLENIEELDTDAYQAEFEKVPDLTEQERRHGKFSSRTIARYLRLRPGQDRTVSNIIKEREMAAKISRFEVSDRIEVISPDGERLPDWLSVGDLGTIKSKDRKTGLWVKWDKRPSDAPFPINPDFAQKTDKPFVPVAPVTAPPVQQPPKPTINKSSIPTPMAVTASTSDEVGSVTFTAAGTKERVLRDQERNEDRTAQENPTPSPVTNLRVFQQWSKVQVVIGVHEGRTGAISSFPAPGFAIVALDATDDAQATRERFKESELELIHHSHEQKAASDVDLKVATRTVVENLHRLLPDELEALESAIAAFKSNWRAAS